MSLQKSMTPLNVELCCFVIEGIDKLLSGDGVGGICYLLTLIFPKYNVTVLLAKILFN